MSKPPEPPRAASDARRRAQHPRVGGVYVVQRHVFPFGDRKPRRPVVVMCEPIVGLDEVWVWTRTSEPVPGIHHPKSPVLGLDRDGWFSELNLKRVAARHLRDPRSARYRGQLELEYFELLKARWDA